MSDCAIFERELAALAAGDVPEREREAALERLQAHARVCADCAGTAALLALLAEPGGCRDLVDDPGDEYWEGFQGRLDRRLGVEQGGSQRPRTARHAFWAAAATAALLVVAAGSWLVLRPGSGPEAELLEGMCGADPVDCYEGLEDLAGFGVEWREDDADGLFPDPSGLDAEARRELLRWLEEQSS